MSAATDLLDRLAEVGAKVEVAGNRLIVRAGAKPVPADLVRRLRAAKAELLAALAPPTERPDAGWWRREFTVRTLDRLLGNRAREEAERLAFNHLVVEWHRQQGKRVAPDLCCGCRRPIGDGRTLKLGDGNSVHFDDLVCVLQHGERWRRAATRALVALGLRPPAGEP